MRNFVIFAILFLFAACGGHPLEGYWAQEIDGGQSGVKLEFDVKGSAVMGHADVDGEHLHVEGSYVFDEAQSALTLTLTTHAELLADANEAPLSGKITGDRIEFGAGDAKITFRRTDVGPGH